MRHLMAASCDSHVSSALTGVLLCGPLLQCHHWVEPVLLLTVISAASALAWVSSDQKQDHHMWDSTLMFPFLLNPYTHACRVNSISNNNAKNKSKFLSTSIPLLCYVQMSCLSARRAQQLPTTGTVRLWIYLTPSQRVEDSTGRWRCACWLHGPWCVWPWSKAFSLQGR